MTAMAVVLAVLSIEADGGWQIACIVGALICAVVCVLNEAA